MRRRRMTSARPAGAGVGAVLAVCLAAWFAGPGCAQQRPAEGGVERTFAVAFDGTHERYVETSHADRLQLREGGTVAAWIELRAARGWQRIVSKSDGAGASGGWDVMLSPRGQLRMTAGGGGGQTEAVVSLDRWTHVAVAFDGEAWRFYLDGEPAGVVETETLPGEDATPLRIGDHPTAPRRFEGAIDEVWIFDRALSDDEVRALASGVSVAEADRLAHWDFREGGGERTADLSGNGHEADVVRAAWEVSSVLVRDASGALSAEGTRAAARNLRVGARIRAIRALDGVDTPLAREVLIAWTADKASTVRAAAVAALGARDGAVVRGALLSALADDAPEVRRTAVEALGRPGETENVTPLFDALSDPDEAVRTAASAALARTGSPAVAHLARALGGGADDGARALAARTLGDMGSPEAVPALRLALAASKAEVRAEGAASLGRVLAGAGDDARGALDALVERLREDEALRVREEAAMALGRIGGDRAWEALTAAGRTDWPLWGYDASRRGASPAALALPETLHLHWTRELHAPRRAWRRQLDDRDKLEFDLSYAPVAADGRVFVGSMTADRLTAYAAEDGRELWRVYADGPIRLAPAVWNDRVFFVSDDGRLHCVAAETGAPLWRFDAAPSPHRVLGNERVVSLWPARGGPVVKDGVVYFASGIWPFLGTFLYALDAATGAVRWANTGHATTWQDQPHGGAHAFSGLAPQGYLAAWGDRLVVSGGRAFPGFFDRATGALVHHHLLDRKDLGGYRVRLDGRFAYNHGARYRLADGDLEADGVFTHAAVEALHKRVASVRDRLDGAVFDAITAGGMLFVTTEAGTLYAFGAAPREAAMHARDVPGPDAGREGSTAAEWAEAILREAPDGGGYALFLGVGDGDLIEQVARGSAFHLVGVDADAEKIDRLRRRFDEAGLYGTRIALIHDDPATAAYPPYISSLVVLEDAGVLGGVDAGALARVFERLRPYDGVAFLWHASSETAALGEALAGLELEGVEAEAGPGHVRLARRGPLPGAGEWTHQYGDAAQTVRSRDERVRLPLGPVWFGGPTNHNVVPRHTTGPRPQVAGGRVVVLGVETLSARCVFTGRELWIREFSGIGHPFTNLQMERQWQEGTPVYMTNMPGATYIGSPYVSLADSIYLRHGGRIHHLDPATGQTRTVFDLPARGEAADGDPDWGHVSVSGDVLLTTTDPHIFDAEERIGSDGGGGRATANWDGSSSERLIALDRRTGEVLWTRDARVGFRHNAIASSGDRVFVIDALTPEALERALRRGLPIQDRPRVMALDLRTGAELWTVNSEVFGTFLSYSEEEDTLVEGGVRDGRTHLADEPTDRLLARYGRDGTVRWEREGAYSGPVILHDGAIIPGRPGPTICLRTGTTLRRDHPVTGEEIEAEYWRSYGCGTANASTHLLLFRSGAAGYTDLAHGGSGTLGGFRAGCTASLVAADGVLNAPDYTRTCTCSYQQQTSLGLVHMPEMEWWVVSRPFNRFEGALVRAGVNLGAPGDRPAEDGTLWGHHPRGREPTLELDVEVEGEALSWYRKSALFVDGAEAPNWIGASGVRGVSALEWREVGGQGRPYTVVLYFAEPDGLAPGERRFDVRVQGVRVAAGYDVARAAGQPDRTVRLAVAGVRVDEVLRLELAAAEGSAHPPVLSGVEIRREDAADVAARL